MKKWKWLIFIIALLMLLIISERLRDRKKCAQPTAAKTAILEESSYWGVGGLDQNGSRPNGNDTVEELKKYDAYYLGTDEKTIYLTFDCGYENGNTEKILDALKKHKVKATFFVVGHFLEEEPDLIKRMVEDGHLVANHTYHHPDMGAIGDKDKFLKELTTVEDMYKEITGQEMVKYYRPPQGKYSKESLDMAKGLGYKTIFWSLAYVDWDTKAQPDYNTVKEKLIKRIHPGAIVLLHNTSDTNGTYLDDILTQWEAMGYNFGDLDKVIQG